jgi:hypothetical protein
VSFSEEVGTAANCHALRDVSAEAQARCDLSRSPVEEPTPLQENRQAGNVDFGNCARCGYVTLARRNLWDVLQESVDG